MPTIEILIAFLVAASVFAYMPGPGTLYTAAQTIARGRRAGLMATLGLHLGGYVHVIAAAAGLSVLFHAVPVMYAVLKLVGAAFLIWLGIKLIVQKTGPDDSVPEVNARSGRSAFIESITIEVLNPKTAIFFLAFLPQFTDVSAALPLWAQFLVLGSIVNVLFSSADLICVFMAGAIVERLKHSERAQKIARRLGGGLLIGLGANLVLQRS